MRFNFPSSFLWGAALSGYQCEGGNFNTDWYLWEQEKKLPRNGIACDHYAFYAQDFAIAKELNCNVLRISVEWARVFPKEGILDKQALRHYQDVIACLRRLNIRPIVTLHHFANPIWFARKGGWAKFGNLAAFLEYVETVVQALKTDVDIWQTINEPTVYVFNGCLEGIWPPGKRSLLNAWVTLQNFAAAHCAAYKKIKYIYQQDNRDAKVSIAQHMRGFYPCPRGNVWLNSIEAAGRNMFFNFALIDYLAKKKSLDFIGLNFYCRESNKANFFRSKACGHDHGYRKNAMGWQIDSTAFYDILMQLKKYALPVIVTENGTAENDQKYYGQYMLTHIKAMAKACRDGVDLQGYLWWSLLDNFEWDKGFERRFGLVDIDYAVQTRTIKPFAYEYAEICKANAVEIDE